MADTAAAAPAKKQFVKPEKPDEDAFKKGLVEKEKEHSAAQEKLVCFYAYLHELDSAARVHLCLATLLTLAAF